MEISRYINNITSSLTLSIDNRAKTLQAEGGEVYNFGVGEPDFETPPHIVEAAIVALNSGFTKYTPSAGIHELREAIAEKLKKDNNIEYSTSDIIVSNGAKQSCFNAIIALCTAGDEVIIPAPYWLSFPEMVKITGAKPIIVETTAENNWKITAKQFENAMTPRTKMIIINSPNNPTGSVYNREELISIGNIAAEEEIAILSDEIYEKLTYDGTEHVSIASLSPELKNLTVTVNGFSKSYAMTGWRLGYLAAPTHIAKTIDSVQSHTTSGACSFSQKGALAAIKGDQTCVYNMKEEFDLRRKYMFDRLSNIKKLKVNLPKGGFYILADISSFGLTSLNFSEKLLSKTGVVVVPGIAFGNDRVVRFSYATGLDVIKAGIDQFETFCKKL